MPLHHLARAHRILATMPDVVHATIAFQAQPSLWRRFVCYLTARPLYRYR